MLPHRARKVRADEYDEWDLFVYMDDENERHLSRIFGSDPETKCVRLLAFAPGAGLVGEDGKVLPDAQDARAIAQAGANAADVVHRQLRRHLPRRVGRLQRLADLVSGAIVGSLHTQKGLREGVFWQAGRLGAKRLGAKAIARKGQFS